MSQEPKPDGVHDLEDRQNNISTKYFDKNVGPDDDPDAYNRGVGGHGFAEVLNNDKLPDNSFFSPGREFEIRVRHSDFPG